MIKVAVCDDEITIQKLLGGYVEQLAKEMEVTVRISYYSSGTELLEHYPHGVDILLLDIQIGALNGIDTAREVRTFDEAVTIFFMTNYAQYAIEGYSVRAYQYLLKPVSYQQFRKEAEPVFRRIADGGNLLLQVKSNQGILSIPYSQIQYVETTVNKNVLIHLERRNILTYATMKQIEMKLLPTQYFYRCHNSYLVNFNYIRELKKEGLLLSNGENIPLSRHRKKDFMNCFAEYMGGLL